MWNWKTVYFLYSYATEGDSRVPKIYTKTGDKGLFLSQFLGKQYTLQDLVDDWFSLSSSPRRFLKHIYRRKEAKGRPYFWSLRKHRWAVFSYRVNVRFVKCIGYLCDCVCKWSASLKFVMLNCTLQPGQRILPWQRSHLHRSAGPGIDFHVAFINILSTVRFTLTRNKISDYLVVDTMHFTRRGFQYRHPSIICKRESHKYAHTFVNLMA